MVQKLGARQGNILIDESGDKSKMKFNRNGFVYEIVLLGKIDCGNVTLRAR
jgi:hypothetical protein